MSKVEIHPAHGEAIGARADIMKQLSGQMSLMRMEDMRHITAVLKQLGMNPEAYEQYDLQVESGRYFLQLTEKKQPDVAASKQVVNGMPQPAAEGVTDANSGMAAASGSAN